MDQRRGSASPSACIQRSNERDEAEFVLQRIRDRTQRGGLRSEVAILYRSNAQSRVFEEVFLSARIPYKVYGGLRFFERAEIKDALAYLRLIANRRDDASFERVVNLPTRGIGAKSLDIIRETAKGLRPVSVGCGRRLHRGCTRPQGRHCRTGFHAVDRAAERDIQGLALHEQVDHVINNSGLIDHHRREKADRGEARVENLEELVSAARGFTGEGSEDLPPLAAFLAHAVLESGEGQADAWEDCIQMMTLAYGEGS